MSQFQFEETEATIELFDSNGDLIDTIVLPADEMVMLESMASEAGVSTEDFIQDVIKTMLQMRESVDNVDS